MQGLLAGSDLPTSQRLSWSMQCANRAPLLLRRPALPTLPSRPHPAPLTVARAVKEDRKTAGGRKGEGRATGSSRTGSASTPANKPGGTTSGRRDGTSHAVGGSGSTRPSSPSPPPLRPPQPQRRSGSSSAPGASRLDLYMRKHPFFSRFYDTTLLLGDCVMILATEASSERIEWSSFPALVGVLLVCWITAGAWNGDYSPTGSRAHEDVPWQLSMLGPTFGSILGAALTWAATATAAAAAYAVLVARNALDAAPVMEGLNSDDLSPQLEVVVALLITMTCWRGIVSKLRPTIPGQGD